MIRRSSVAMFILSLLSIWSICSISAQNPPENSSWLTPKKLADAGVHLPSYMPSLNQQLAYQGALKFHQELTVEWNSLPGRAEKINKDDVEGLKVQSDFLITGRRHNVPGPPGIGNPPMLVTGQLIIVASTETGEIRSIDIQSDPRASHTESVREHKRTDFVTPTVTMTIVVPDDPAIRAITFLSPALCRKDGMCVEKIAEFQLPETKPRRL